MGLRCCWIINSARNSGGELLFPSLLKLFSKLGELTF